MLSKGITANLINIQAIIVACAVLHNICIDMSDILPEEEDLEDYDDIDENIVLNDFPHLIVVNRGRQERDRLIRDHFANL